MRGCDGRPQNNTSNLSRPRAWIETNSSALSPTLLWPCPEQRGVTMGCLYLKIEGQSCLVGSVDQGLMKSRQINLLDSMTQQRARKKHFSHIFPIATLPGNFQQIIPPKKMQTFRPNYRLSIVIKREFFFFNALLVYSGQVWRWYVAHERRKKLKNCIPWDKLFLRPGLSSQPTNDRPVQIIIGAFGDRPPRNQNRFRSRGGLSNPFYIVPPTSSTRQNTTKNLFTRIPAAPQA